MRMFLATGRQCLRQTLPRIRTSIQCRNIRSATRQSYRNSGGGGGGGEGSWRRRGSWQFKSPPQTKGLILAAAAGLSPTVFVRLSEKDNGGTEMTAEGRMLEASREEISKKVGDDVRGLQRVRDSIIYFLDAYLWEPLCTSIRFLRLVVIFVPVLVTIPAAYFGPRDIARDNERMGTLWWYRFLVKAMERAGPAFIKLGQWAASRSDIFPSQMCEIMSQLHSNAPAHSLHATKRIISSAFDGRPFDDIFEEFQEQPLGVGAIAQVYKAKLKPDLATPGDPDLQEPTNIRRNVRKNVGTLIKSTPQRVPSSYVAIKVLHPGVERVVRRDLRIMWVFASVINLIPTFEWLSFPDEVEQFGQMMRLQLDLRIEAANLSIFRKNFKPRTTAWFPFPYTQFTTRQVLVEEFAQGIPLSDFMENGGGVFQQDIADEGLDAFLRMLLIDNFIHADLHPGNIMVRFYQSEKPNLPFSKHKDEDPQSQPDVTEQVLARLQPYRHRKDPQAWQAELSKIDKEGFRPQLIFIDTGLVTELNATNRRNFLDLFKAVAEFDGYKAGHLMCQRCRQPDAVIDEEIYSLKMQHLVLGVKSRTLALGNMKIGDILNEVLSMVRTHHVRMEGDFVNVVISILLLEGIGRSLNPDIDLLSSALPILRELGAQSGGGMLRQGDFSMLKVWAGLEARKFLQASIEDVERCVKYDLLSPNV
ncbi:uncharacterized protein EAE97_007578 [Botrytis byssoidea]|uniref:ABC1 atypical kinase-like domain-containing protein n=1 Tax=Botrytis byssoidea TaxID=139641 RepID=A0A9P5IJF7_9HELO|nr:uncharacterized protein EAE97_007578 [Botrytis byssoidea]KAF7937782.1 hypothetical protein EAE97_007578 [Botrytis byssoidea]